MKKMQCEVCGSNEIRKIADDIFECQSCGVQYSTAETKKLLIEVSGTVKIDHSDEVANKIKRAQQFEQAGDNKKAEEYYNAALDMDADNQLAQQQIEKISEQKTFSDYFVIEPEINPQENVKLFLEQLAATQNIACDIYKEIEIKSVTEKYMTFFFIKGKYKFDWSAIACHTYYENETVYKKVYNPDLKRYVTEPVTKQVEKVNRIPRNGSKTKNCSELVLASDNLSKLFSAETQTIKDNLLSAFEKQQVDKYGTYNIAKIDTRNIQKENNKVFYKGIELDTKTDNRIYSDKKKKMAQSVSDSILPEIQKSIGGNYYENLTGNMTTLSETAAYICIPVQIIEYTYKEKTYTALSDLISHTTTKPFIYPCDTELKNAINKLNNQKEAANRSPGLIIGTILGIAAFAIIPIAMIFPDLEYFFLTIFCVTGVIGLILIFGSLINEHLKKNKFKNNAEDIRNTLFNPRIEAIEKTKELFFKEYSNYDSAKKAAANTDCISIAQTTPELSESGPIRKKMAFVTNTVHNDETITTLENGISQLQEKKKNGILAFLIGGAAAGSFGLLLLMLNDITSFLYLFTHSIVIGILWAIVILGFGTAILGAIIFGSVMNSRIQDLKIAIDVYKQRKQIEEEFENPQDHQEITDKTAQHWSDERIREKVAEISEQQSTNEPLKLRILNSIKKNKIPSIIAGCFVLLLVVAISTEAIICRATVKPYVNGLINKSYTFAEEREDYIATDTFSFYSNGRYERTEQRIGKQSDVQVTSSYEKGKYTLHYDFIQEEYTLILGASTADIVHDNHSNIISIKLYHTYKVISDTENSSDGDVISETTETTVENDIISQQQSNCAHLFTSVTCTTPEFCTLCNETVGAALGHSYIEATCTTPKTCNRCNETSGSALGHSYIEATCTTPKKCSVCKNIAEDSLGHSWIYDQYTTIFAEEGHYEDVQKAKKVERYRCFPCAYYQPTYATLDEYYAHFDSTHADNPNSAFLRKNYEIIEETIYETVTEWVIDREESTKTIYVRSCENCGETEEY